MTLPIETERYTGEATINSQNWVVLTLFEKCGGMPKSLCVSFGKLPKYLDQGYISDGNEKIDLGETAIQQIKLLITIAGLRR